MPVVSVVNMKGGVAKTTLAVNLADNLARREQCSVLIIDLDPQFNATQCLLNGEDYVARRQSGGATIVSIFDDSPPVSISPVVGTKVATHQTLSEIKPWAVKKNLDLIPGDLELYRLEMGGSQGREMRLKRYIEATKANDKYDYILIDTPPTPSHWMTAALLASSCYIVPVKPEPLSRTGVDLLKSVVDRCSQNFAHSIECIGVVLTIVESNTIVFRDAKQFFDDNAVWRGKRFSNNLPKRTKIASAQGSQRMILDLDDADAKLALSVRPEGLRVI